MSALVWVSLLSLGKVQSNGKGDGKATVMWQAANGDPARLDFWIDPIVLGGLCDSGGWLIAVRTKDEWLAIGDHCGQVAWERLPEGFKPELP